jgi:mannose-6-phosphate isomerase-like protein (cupin superfamily)
MTTTVNLDDKFSLFKDQWSPRLVGRINDMDVKLVRIEGEFIWHTHEKEDEMFFVIAGELTMRFREGSEKVRPGEFIIIPHGVEHMPVTTCETKVMLIEPSGTLNTGNVKSDRTRKPIQI